MQDLENARNAITNLKDDLKSERKRLATFAAEQRHAADDKETIVRQLKLAQDVRFSFETMGETDLQLQNMRDIKAELQTMEREKGNLLSELERAQLESWSLLR